MSKGSSGINLFNYAYLFLDLDEFDEEAVNNKKRGQKPKKVSQAVLVNRYPKRNIPVTNYADIEVPDDDHFLCTYYLLSSEAWQL